MDRIGKNRDYLSFGGRTTLQGKRKTKTRTKKDKKTKQIKKKKWFWKVFLFL